MIIEIVVEFFEPYTMFSHVNEHLRLLIVGDRKMNMWFGLDLLWLVKELKYQGKGEWIVFGKEFVLHLFLWIFLVGTNGTLQCKCYNCSTHTKADTVKEDIITWANFFVKTEMPIAWNQLNYFLCVCVVASTYAIGVFKVDF